MRPNPFLEGLRQVRDTPHTLSYIYFANNKQITVLFTFRTAHFARQPPARFHCVKQTCTPSTPIPHPRSSSSSIPWRVVRSPPLVVVVLLPLLLFFETNDMISPSPMAALVCCQRSPATRNRRSRRGTSPKTSRSITFAP